MQEVLIKIEVVQTGNSSILLSLMGRSTSDFRSHSRESLLKCRPTFVLALCSVLSTRWRSRPVNEIKPRPLLLIARYVAAGTLAGLLVGVLDGFYSYRFPRPRVLLRSDVSYVVLLLGPLLDGVAAGLLGLIAGLFVASRSSRCWSRTASVLGLCAIAVLLLFFARNEKSIVHSLMGGSPLTLAVAAKAAAVLLLLGAFRAALLLPVRILSKSLATAAPILLLGLGAYIVRPMRPADTAAIAAAPKGEPNVILITLDTVRADHLSLYGYSRPTTPNIDRWARQGVVFENAMAPAPWTLASHASIFTGLLPHQHGAEFAVPLDPRWWMLAEVLASRGYETAGLTANLMYGATGWGLDKGFGLYDDDSTSIRHNLRSLFLGKRLLQPIYGNMSAPTTLIGEMRSRSTRTFSTGLSSARQDPSTCS